MRFISILLLCISTFSSTFLFGQTNESAICSDAFIKSVDTTCIRTSHNVGLAQNQYWIEFSATSETIQLNTLINETAPVISAVQLISGTCSNFQVMETDSSFAIGGNITFASNLVIGQTYFICLQIASNLESKFDACILKNPVEKAIGFGIFYFTDQNGNIIECPWTSLNYNTNFQNDSVMGAIHSCQELTFCITDTICITMSQTIAGGYTYPETFDFLPVFGLPFATTTFNSDFSEACITFNATGTSTVFLDPMYSPTSDPSSNGYSYVGGAINQWVWNGSVQSYMNINVVNQTPPATSNSQNALCIGENYTIEAFGSTTITEVIVNNVQIFNPNSNTWSTSFNTPGQYTIEYTVDGLCYPVTYFDTVMVIDSSDVTLTIDACNNATFTFSTCLTYSTVTLTLSNGVVETLYNFTGSISWTYPNIVGPITWILEGEQQIYWVPMPVFDVTFAESGIIQAVTPQPIVLTAPLYLCDMNPNVISITAPSGLQNIVWSTTPTYSFTGQGTTSITPTSWPTNQGNITVNVNATDINGCPFAANVIIEQCCMSKSIINSSLNGEYFEKTYLQYADFQNQLNTVVVNSPSNVIINLSPQPSLVLAINTPFGVSINATQLLALTGSSGNTISINNWLFINEDVYLDQDLNILGCQFIRIAPGKRFIVNPGKTLNIRSSTLAPKCDEMWGGIYLSSGTSNLICLTSNIIAAKIGVESIAGAPFDVDFTNFIDNFYGIVMRTYNGTHPGRVNRSYFGDNTVTNLLPPFAFFDRPQIGISAESVTNVYIGDVSAGGNTFQRIRNGIFTKQCGLYVQSNTFFQIVENPTVLTSAGASNHNAIRAIGNASAAVIPHKMAFIGSGAVLNGNNFLSCRDNIVLESNMDAEIQNNYQRNITYRGVSASNNINGYLHINDNKFVSGNSNAFGNYIFQHTNAIVIVEDNNFNASASSIPARLGAGIYIGDVTIGTYFSVPRIKVKNNIISNAVYGIYSVNVNHPYVSDNEIRFSLSQTLMNADPSYAYTGIYFAGSPNAEAYRNDVLNNYLYNPNTAVINEFKLRGIRLENSLSSKIKLNYMLKTPAGFDAVYQNGSSEIYCNTFAHNKWGFFFEKAEIGDQGYPPNVIPMWPNGLGADNKWTLTPPINLKSDGTRLNPLASYLDYYHTTQPPNQSQYYSNPTSLLAGPNQYIDQVLNISTDGQIPRTACDLTIPALITIPDVVAERFKNYGRFIDGSIPDSLPNLNQLRFAKEHTFRKMSFDPNYLTLGAPDDSLYLNFIADYQNSETKRVIDVQQNILDENYSTAILQNNTIGSSCFHSENNKLIQSIYLNSLDSGLVIISATDSTILEDMACQDPLEFGNAVYQARAMIGWLHPCNFGGGAKSLILNDNMDETLLNIQKNNIQLFPNPSNGDFTINSSEFEIMELIIRDLSGKIIYHNTDLNTKEIELHLDKNPKGLYLLEIRLSNNVSHHDKIIVE